MKMNFDRQIEKLAEKIAEFIGKPVSIILHTAAFAVILALPVFGYEWDRVLLSLTSILSIEAIYLALFNQMITNKAIENG